MKRLFIILFIILSFSLFILPVSAFQVANGAIPSAALEYFEGVVTKLPDNHDYFLFRSSDYVTTLVSSEDLHLEGNSILGTDVTCYEYNTRALQNNNYNNIPSFSKTTYLTFAVDTDVYSIAYSSLGDWSPLISREESKSNNWIQYILWSVVLILLVFIAFKLIRNRRSYVNL